MMNYYSNTPTLKRVRALEFIPGSQLPYMEISGIQFTPTKYPDVVVVKTLNKKFLVDLRLYRDKEQIRVYSVGDGWEFITRKYFLERCKRAQDL